MSLNSTRTRICVFCSTKTGIDPTGPQAATRLGEALHRHNVELIYGGGTTGLMGEVSRTRTRLGGMESVLGVIPYALIDRERDVQGETAASSRWKLAGMLSTLGVGKTAPSPTTNAQATGDVHDLPSDPNYGRVVGVSSLTRRKRLMIDLVQQGGPGSGFVALPGAFGSLDEVLEVIMHRQLGVHKRPMVLVNVDGFWNGLQQWMENAVGKGFLGDDSRAFMKIVETPEEAVEFCLQYSYSHSP